MADIGRNTDVAVARGRQACCDQKRLDDNPYTARFARRAWKFGYVKYAAEILATRAEQRQAEVRQ